MLYLAPPGAVGISVVSAPLPHPTPVSVGGVLEAFRIFADRRKSPPDVELSLTWQ